MIKNSVETIIQGHKVIYKRYFDVPVDLVFEAWSSPEHLSQWWGPDGFTLTTKKMEFFNGGFWEFRDGTNLTMEQIFPSKEELERVNKKYGAIEGGIQHLGNLGKYLEKLKLKLKIKPQPQ